MATVRLLDSPVAAEHVAAFDRWMAGRIRKHVRRARGAKWEKVQVLPGLTAAHGGAEVRAFVPTSVDEIYPEVARLQLSGRDLDDPSPHGDLDLETGVLLVAVSAETPMSWTKQAAAAAHAAQVARIRMPDEPLQRWRSGGFAVRVEQPGTVRWRQLVENSPVTIADAGFTEVEPGTVTAVARWA